MNTTSRPARFPRSSLCGFRIRALIPTETVHAQLNTFLAVGPLLRFAAVSHLCEPLIGSSWLEAPSEPDIIFAATRSRLSFLEGFSVFCSKCGARCSDDASYCHKCGSRLYRDDEATENRPTFVPY